LDGGSRHDDEADRKPVHRLPRLELNERHDETDVVTAYNACGNLMVCSTSPATRPDSTGWPGQCRRQRRATNRAITARKAGFHEPGRDTSRTASRRRRPETTCPSSASCPGTARQQADDGKAPRLEITGPQDDDRGQSPEEQ
jgi:hypothetical protein